MRPWPVVMGMRAVDEEEAGCFAVFEVVVGWREDQGLNVVGPWVGLSV